DWAGGTVIGAAGAANWACNSRLPLTASSATIASRTNNKNRGRINQHQPISASVFVAGQRLPQFTLRAVDGFERLRAMTFEIVRRLLQIGSGRVQRVDRAADHRMSFANCGASSRRRRIAG